MKPGDNPNWFAGNPVDRAYERRAQDGFLTSSLAHPDSIIIPLWRGDPLIADGRALFLSASARNEFPHNAPLVFLGLHDGKPHFAIDASSAAQTADAAPFADLGEYAPIRAAAAAISRDDLAMIGHARWLFEWHRKHQFCPVCGAQTKFRDGGAKRQCEKCEAEHFPRSDPVAIVLATHEDACLLGRGPHFSARLSFGAGGFR